MEISHNVTPMNHNFQIILGSSSKARRQILTEMGYKFTIVTADIDEKNIRKENPEDLVVALAEAKADAIITRLKKSGQLDEILCPTLLITADTVVVCRGIIREKPSNEEEARQFIRGGSAQVVGSVVVTNLVTGTRKGGFDTAEVYFLDIPDEVVDNLIKEGINWNVAGGLTLERALTFPLIETVAGSVDCINGLSKTLTEKLIHHVL